MPAGIWPDAKSAFCSEPFFTFDPVTALFAIFGLVTALFLSAAVLTLFDGAVADTAAMLVPPRATRSAIDAITVAGVIRKRTWCLT